MAATTDDRCALVLNYYHPWVWAGAERFNQMAREELRQGRSQAYVYVSDGGLRHVVEAQVRTPEHQNLLLFQLVAPDRVAAVSPAAAALAAGGTLTLGELVGRVRPRYARSHVPVSHYVGALSSPPLRDVPFVYDVMDLWCEFEKTPWGDGVTESCYLDRADAVIVVSRLLLERLAHGGKGHLVPNGIDRLFLERISPGAHGTGRPPGAAKRVLYMGALGGSWYDWDVVRRLVAELHDHELTFIGPTTLPPEEVISGQDDVEDHLAALRAAPNATVVAEVPHDDLVPWLRAADVGIIPFLPGPLTEAVSPLKVYEYLGAGAVVVQAGMPDIKDYPGVRSASDEQEFVDLVRASDRSLLDEAERREMARFCERNTWAARVREFDEIVDGLG